MHPIRPVVIGIAAQLLLIGKAMPQQPGVGNEIEPLQNICRGLTRIRRDHADQRA